MVYGELQKNISNLCQTLIYVIFVYAILVNKRHTCLLSFIIVSYFIIQRLHLGRIQETEKNKRLW